MRKYLAGALAAFMALACLNVAVAGADVQSINAKLTPKKLSKKKYKPATIAITVATQNNDQAGDSPPEFQNQPPAATRTIVDFPKNMKFNTNAAPHCKVNDAALANTTTEQATDLCGKKSIVSVGEQPGPGFPKKTGAVQRVGGAVGFTDYDVVVTAFNGQKKNTLYLHARVQALPITAVLVGKLTKNQKASLSNGPSLDVTVPVLAAGGIKTFKTTVKHGKYVQARCKQKNMTFGARSTYNSGPNTDHTPTKATFKTKCKQKK